MYWNRNDGTLVPGLPLNRRAMPYIMRTRPESAFYFQYDVQLTKTDDFLSSFNDMHPDTPADVLHVALYALRDVYVRYPTLNRFVAGGRIYDRNGISFTYSSRHAPLSGAPAVTIKRFFEPDETFAEMVEGMHEDLHNAEPHPTGLFRVAERLMTSPGMARRVAFRAIHAGNALGVLPARVHRCRPAVHERVLHRPDRHRPPPWVRPPARARHLHRGLRPRHTAGRSLSRAPDPPGRLHLR